MDNAYRNLLVHEGRRLLLSESGPHRIMGVALLGLARLTVREIEALTRGKTPIIEPVRLLEGGLTPMPEKQINEGEGYASSQEEVTEPGYATPEEQEAVTVDGPAEEVTNDDNTTDDDGDVDLEQTI